MMFIKNKYCFLHNKLATAQVKIFAGTRQFLLIKPPLSAVWLAAM
ncbi:hypothetical protein FM737_004419 [Escherichia marmotae]|nr:hypothetical protein A1SC_01879 [Escherichia sp. KTE52]EOV48875.1 hypothetical protein A1SC_01801 [Escherichia sp. KTE52]EOW39485.1 hypothetical protein A1YG_05032 [Escherichia coli KTE130]KAF3708796.1 hypothetical protein FM737_004419 [Escherichia marmotae]